MALAATLRFQEGCIILSFNGANAINNISRHQMIPTLADLILVATRYATNLYSHHPPKLLFAIERHTTEIIPSVHGMQQGCSFCPACYSASLLKFLREFRETSPVSETRGQVFIDKIMLNLLPETNRDISTIDKTTLSLQDRRALGRVKLNRKNLQALLI